LQGPPVAVVATAPDGTEARTTVTDAPSLPQTVTATQHVVPELVRPESPSAQKVGLASGLPSTAAPVLTQPDYFHSVIEEMREAQRKDAVYQSLHEDDINYIVWRWDSENELDPPSTRLNRKQDAKRNERRKTVFTILAALIGFCFLAVCGSLYRESQARHDDSAEMDYLREKAQHNQTLDAAIKDADEFIEGENQP
jgi:hypothetical protein